MQSVPSGSAPFTLSVLAGGGTGIGTTAEQGLASTISLAHTADRRGFRRFWMSEHHAMPALSVASPPLMIARLIAETSRIRLGAGGIMLPNHAPLAVAEQFGMLTALAPHRIDLGLGRAPGTDDATARALRRGANANDGFPQQVTELLGFLTDEFPAGHPYRDVHAVPGPWQAAQNRIRTEEFGPEIWMLGSSPFSAQLAAQLGRPYAFALQFGNADIDTALHIYREQFQSSEVLAEPHTLVSVPVAISDDSSRRSVRRRARRWRCCGCSSVSPSSSCRRTRSRRTRPPLRRSRYSTPTPTTPSMGSLPRSPTASKRCTTGPASTR